MTVELVDDAGNVIATTLTDPAGNYSFTNVAEGRYAVNIVAPQDAGYSPPDAGSDDTTDSDPSWLTGTTDFFDIALSGCTTLLTDQRPDSADCNPVMADMDGGLIDRDLDLALTKTLATTADLEVGDNAVWEIQVTNEGNIPVVGATVVDDLPNNLSFVSVAGSGWDCSFGAGALTCETTQVLLPDDAAEQLVVTTNVEAAGDVVNEATVSVLESLDTTPGNNQATATTSATAAPSGPLAFSGSSWARLLGLVALVFLLAGCWLVVVQRRLGTNRPS